MNNDFAPVIIPTLNRLDHLKACLESLSKCTWADQTEVYVGLDYPPSPKYEEGYQKVRNFLESCGDMGFKKLHVIKREMNYGPLKNGKELKDFIFSKYDKVIYSEDDIEFAPNVLDFFKKAFEKYKNNKDVVGISAYSYPIEWKVSEGATCLKQGICASAWGFGMWRDKDVEMRNYLYTGGLKRNLKKAVKGGLYDAMIEIARCGYVKYACTPRFKDKNRDLWRVGCDFSIRCYLGIERKYFLSPILSMTRNHGFDGSGDMCGAISGDFSNTALTYDYEHQPIDTRSDFDLIEDTLHDDMTNRDILSAFDSRSEKELERGNRLIWLCENVGVWAGKLYATIMFPFDIIKNIVKR